MEKIKAIKNQLTIKYARKVADITINRTVIFSATNDCVSISLDGNLVGNMAIESYNTLYTAIKSRKKIDNVLIKEINDARQADKVKVESYVDNCAIRAFQALEKFVKKADKQKAFRRENIVFSYLWKDNNYVLSCVPKYSLSSDGYEYIIFRGLDCNSIVALKRKDKANRTDTAINAGDSEIEYIVRGKLSAKAYNAGSRNLQAMELEGLTKTILNSYFNGMSWNQAYELCKRCKKFDAIAFPVALK